MTNKKLQEKIMRILADYKYNPNQAITTRTTADRIILIIKNFIKEKK